METKPDPLIDPSLIYQQTADTNPISIADMAKKRNEGKEQAIQAILEKTNYKDVMEEFVQSTSRNNLCLRIDGNVSSDLDKFTFDEIQETVHDVYTHNEYKENNIVVWTYGKHGKVDGKHFRKASWWLRCLIESWWITFFIYLVTIFVVFTTPSCMCNEDSCDNISTICSAIRLTGMICGLWFSIGLCIYSIITKFKYKVDDPLNPKSGIFIHYRDDI
jgi:hypothetical protein